MITPIHSFRNLVLFYWHGTVKLVIINPSYPDNKKTYDIPENRNNRRDEFLRGATLFF